MESRAEADLSLSPSGQVEVDASGRVCLRVGSELLPIDPEVVEHFGTDFIINKGTSFKVTGFVPHETDPDDIKHLTIEVLNPPPEKQEAELLLTKTEPSVPGAEDEEEGTTAGDLTTDTHKTTPPTLVNPLAEPVFKPASEHMPIAEPVVVEKPDFLDLSELGYDDSQSIRETFDQFKEAVNKFISGQAIERIIFKHGTNLWQVTRSSKDDEGRPLGDFGAYLLNKDFSLFKPALSFTFNKVLKEAVRENNAWYLETQEHAYERSDLGLAERLMESGNEVEAGHCKIPMGQDKGERDGIRIGDRRFRLNPQQEGVIEAIKKQGSATIKVTGIQKNLNKPGRVSNISVELVSGVGEEEDTETSAGTEGTTTEDKERVRARRAIDRGGEDTEDGLVEETEEKKNPDVVWSAGTDEPFNSLAAALAEVRVSLPAEGQGITKDDSEQIDEVRPPESIPGMTRHNKTDHFARAVNLARSISQSKVFVWDAGKMWQVVKCREAVVKTDRRVSYEITELQEKDKGFEPINSHNITVTHFKEGEFPFKGPWYLDDYIEEILAEETAEADSETEKPNKELEKALNIAKNRRDSGVAFNATLEEIVRSGSEIADGIRSVAGDTLFELAGGREQVLTRNENGRCRVKITGVHEDQSKDIPVVDVEVVAPKPRIESASGRDGVTLTKENFHGIFSRALVNGDDISIINTKTGELLHFFDVERETHNWVFSDPISENLILLSQDELTSGQYLMVQKAN